MQIIRCDRAIFSPDKRGCSWSKPYTGETLVTREQTYIKTGQLSINNYAQSFLMHDFELFYLRRLSNISHFVTVLKLMPSSWLNTHRMLIILFL